MYSWEAKDNYYYTIQHQTHFSSYFKSTVKKKKKEYDYVIYGLNSRLWLVLNNPLRTNFQWKVLHLWLRSANPCSIIIAVIHNKMMRLIRVTHDKKTVYTHHNKLHRYNNIYIISLVRYNYLYFTLQLAVIFRGYSITSSIYACTSSRWIRVSNVIL